MRFATTFGLILTGWLLLSRPLWAQPESRSDYRIDHIGVNDGLTQGSVYHLLQDSRNFLWVGTQDGLNRYDGYRFRHYHPEEGDSTSISGINILGIVEDGEQNLWIGTDNGLNCYERAHDRFRRIPARDDQGRPVRCRTVPFYADEEEVLFLSELQGLLRHDLNTGQTTVIRSDLKPLHEYDQLRSTVRTPSGDVWLHASKGLIRYNLEKGTIDRYFSDHPDNRAGPPMAIFSFIVELSGRVWLGTANGLIRFDPKDGRYRIYKPSGNRPLSVVYSMTRDKLGRLWIGTQNTGVWIVNTNTGKFSQLDEFTDVPKKLSQYEINLLYSDKQGIIWANTDPDGLARILPERYRFGGVHAHEELNRTRLSSFIIRGFLEASPSEIWLATERGIDVLNRSDNRVLRHYLADVPRSNVPTRHVVKCLTKDQRGQIWVGTVGGVYEFLPKTQSFRKIPLPATNNNRVIENYVRKLTPVGQQTLIAATEDGAFALDIRQRTIRQLPILQDQNIFCFLQDKAGRLWCGTLLSGFYCYETLPMRPTNRPRSVIRGLNGFTVLDIMEDTLRHTVWMATDKGLAAVDLNTGKITLYGTREGLVNSFVYGILMDRNRRLWMSTNRGIARFDPTTHQFKNFDLSDGLQGYEFNGNAFLRASDGEMFFGGVNGFNRFYPERFRISSYTPRVHIFNLKVNEEPVERESYIGEASQLELSYDQNTLYLEFAALDFFSNGKNQYQYRLVGLDRDWVQAGSNTYVRYTKLPPGQYQFQVRAANKDGQWSPLVRKLDVRVYPPLWRNPWFLSMMVLLLGLLGFVWFRRRENRIRRQHQQNVRLAVDLQEQIKKNLARDLHDEIGTRLATLKLYVSRMKSPSDNGSGDIGMSARELISDIISDVRNLLRELNPRTLEQYGYVPAVEELLTRIDESTLQTRFYADRLPGRLDGESEIMLYRITQELLNNTLKHANATLVDVKLMLEDHKLRLYYTDDGQGFDFFRTRRGLGIGNIESRVALLNGRIDWYTAPGSGTQVIVEIPYRSAGRFQSLRRAMRQLTTAVLDT